MTKKIIFIDFPLFQEKIPEYALDIFQEHFYLQSNVVVSKLNVNHNVGKFKQYTHGLLLLIKEFEINGYDCIYLNNPTSDEILTYINDNIKGILVSCVSSTYYLANRIAADIKVINNKIPLLLGGYHATFCYESLIESRTNFDILVLFEGEHIALQAVEAYDTDKIYNCKNIVLNNGSGYVGKIERGHYKDFSPAFHALGNLAEYHHNIFYARGCIFSCNFCCNSNFSLRKEQPFDIFWETIQFLDKNLPKDRLIYFSDSIFINSYDFLKEFCEKYSKLTDNRPFGCDMHPNSLSVEKIILLSNVGCKEINVGLESADENVLLACNKKINPEDFKKTLRDIRPHTHNLLLNLYWMVGLPCSTANTMKIDFDYFDYLYDNNLVDIIKAKLFVPYPGTYFFDNTNKFNISIINQDFNNRGRFSYPAMYSLKDRDEFQLYDELICYIKYLTEKYKSISNNQIKTKTLLWGEK